MGILDLLLESVPNAPGSGLGPIAAGAGTGPSGAGAGPAMCPSQDPGEGPDDGPDTDPDLDDGPDDRPDDDGPDDRLDDDGQDHTPEGTYTRRYPLMSWEAVMDGDGEYSDGSTPGAPTDSGGGDSFFFPESGPSSYYMIRALERYGDWINDGDGAWGRTGRALTGVVVLPPAAILTCAENSIRSPLL